MLFITAFPPNHRSGGQTFSYNALNDLKNYYQIDLVYFDYEGHEYESIDGVTVIQVFQPSLIGCIQLPICCPVFTRRFSFKVLWLLRKIIKNYDILYFDFSQVAVYSSFLKHNNKIIRCHDILAQKYKRKKTLLYPWVKLSENIILKSANRIFTPSYKDSAIITETYGLQSEYTNEYLATYSIPDDVELIDSFILFGLWSRNENLNGLIWFVENIVEKESTDLGHRLVVMGGGLSEEIEQKYLKPHGIKYLGYVDDCYNEIVKYKAMIAPLFDGAGIKVKVLDSFNTGTAVIGTDVAFEGIKDLPGLTIRANSAEEFNYCITSINEYDISEKQVLQKKFLSYYDNRHLSELLLGGYGK